MRFRKLRIAWSVFWGLAAVLLVVLWVRSYRAFDRISGYVGKHYTITLSYAGRLSIVHPHQIANSLPYWNRDSGPILPNNWTEADLKHRTVNWDDTDVVWPNRNLMGFGWFYHELYCCMPNGEAGWNPRGLSGRSYAADSSGLMIPHWFIALLFVGLACIQSWSLRFSLRTLLIATTLVAVVLGLIVYVARQ
jgi:hypothetical protein